MDDRYDCTPVIHLWHVIDRIFETTRGSTCIAFRSFFGVQGTEFSLIQWRWNMVCYDVITIPDSSDEPLSVIRASKVISQFLFASDQIAPRDSSVTAGVTNRNLETTWVWTRFFEVQAKKHRLIQRRWKMWLRYQSTKSFDQSLIVIRASKAIFESLAIADPIASRHPFTIKSRQSSKDDILNKD